MKAISIQVLLFLLFIAAFCFITTESIGQETKQSDSLGHDFGFPHPEEELVFKSGLKVFYERLHEQLLIPSDLKTTKKVFIQFTVDTSGEVNDIAILKDITEEINNEAIRAFKAVGEKFEPGKVNGKPVEVRMTLPITFDPEKKKEYQANGIL